ncbi:MAG: nicotinamide-nucleotide amidase [Burkholderiales bacterium]|nr:nicotinamide-nucleotide amidase [Burkholderiales bacterium]
MASDMLAALATRVGAALKAKGLMLAAAESCTGGWVAQAVTAIAGSSDWFERGYVTYSDAAKQDMLGVRAESLARHGAVSEEVAREMAAGALANSRAQVALAITGIAGPGGGSPEKPVGTVCFAWAVTAGASSTQTRYFDGDRESVRRQSVTVALQGVLEMLEADSDSASRPLI